MMFCRDAFKIILYINVAVGSFVNKTKFIFHVGKRIKCLYLFLPFFSVFFFYCDGLCYNHLTLLYMLAPPALLDKLNTIYFNPS